MDRVREEGGGEDEGRREERGRLRGRIGGVEGDEGSRDVGEGNEFLREMFGRKGD